MKMCIACGMPMTSIADYPRHDITKNYCKHCALDDGTMITLDEKVNNLAIHYRQTYQMDEQVALETAKVVLKKLPAWRRKW